MGGLSFAEVVRPARRPQSEVIFFQKNSSSLRLLPALHFDSNGSGIVLFFTFMDQHFEDANLTGTQHHSSYCSI